MSAPLDITGQQFGRLTAVRYTGSSGYAGRKWLFLCTCGNEIETRVSAVRGGHAKSCGCMQREKAVQSAKIARAALADTLPPMPERFWLKIDKRGPDECWPWKAAVRRKDEGYGAFYFELRQQPASRVAWILTNGEVSDDLEVCHTCDNPPCCNPGHLFLGTRKQNNDDKVAKKRHVFGSRVGTATLTEEQAQEIKYMKPAGRRAAPGYRSGIAKRFSVSCETVTEIWAGRRWTHLR